jgi:subtilisin family serine protease
MDVHGTAPGVIPGQYIIGFKPGVSQEARAAAVQSLDARSTEPLDFVNGMLVVDPAKGINALSANPDSPIAWVQPNYTHELRGPASAATLPNDPELKRQYHLDNNGQTGGTKDADVNAPEAWATSTGKNVIVALADTNIDIEHPDIAANVWTNTKEVAGNGVDDDKNGFVDDVHGWNFARNNNRPQDGRESHGTHVAGIVGAVANNATGGSGVAPNVQIMPVPVLGGSGATSNAIKAFEYAVRNGANVISNSWGNNTYEPALQAAVTAATQGGALVVVAAGNENWDTGVHGSYPDNYAGSVSIGASDDDDRKASYSNRGTTTIDVAAPGDKVYSTLPGNKYGELSGTSMAAPVYSGIAALVKSAYPDLTMKQVEDRIFRSVQKNGNAAAWNPLVASGGRVDAASALLPIATPENIGPAHNGTLPKAGKPMTVAWQTDVRDQKFDVEATLNAGAKSAVDETFESGAPSRAFQTSGDAQWAVGAGNAKDGAKAFQVAGLGTDKQSRLELTETLPEETELSFWYKGARNGELSFFVDRDLQFQPTTSENWQEFRTTLPAGEHNLRWLAAGRRGSTGTFAIDNVRIGSVSDAKWEPVGTTGEDQTHIEWSPNAASTDAQVRVRADNGSWKGAWVPGETFTVNENAR